MSAMKIIMQYPYNDVNVPCSTMDVVVSLRQCMFATPCVPVNARRLRP